MASSVTTTVIAVRNTHHSRPYLWPALAYLIHLPRQSRTTPVRPRMLSMNQTRRTPKQFPIMLREATPMLVSGRSVAQALQALGVIEATLSQWRSQYGG